MSDAFSLPNAVGTTVLGDTFAAAFIAAGLSSICPTFGSGEAFTWAPGATDAQMAEVAAFVAKHDPGDGRPALMAYASDRQDAVLAGAWRFDVAAAGAAAHTVTTKLDDKGQVAMMKLALWLQLNAAAASGPNPPTSPYSNVDGSPDTLTFAEVDSLVLQAGALDTRSYAILNQLSAGISASPPTVTTRDQVDAAFAALMPAA